MNKITRKSFLKVLAATMVGGAAASALTGAAAPVSIDETNGKGKPLGKEQPEPGRPADDCQARNVLLRRHGHGTGGRHL